MYDNLILATHKGIEEKDLNNLEKRLHVKMPKAVREHFLTYNGGYPEKPVFVCEDGDMYVVDYFIPIKEEKGQNVEKILKLLRDDKAIPDWLIPFADEEGGNLFCFSVRESDSGSIYYYDHEFEYGDDPEEHVKYLAKSIDIFINSLIDDEEEEEDDENEKF